MALPGVEREFAPGFFSTFHFTTSPAMSATSFDPFLSRLAARPSGDDVFNQYSQPECLQNLRHFLEHLSASGSDVFLVGEAPGYRGCRLTGIPFSSPRLLLESKAPIFQALRPNLFTSSDVSEASARIVWETLEQAKTLPLLWNAFPFHPHRIGHPNSNRPLRKKELAEGVSFLAELAAIFQPGLFVAVGRSAQHALATAFSHLPIEYVRHPSYGGKSEFQRQLSHILRQTRT